MSKQPATRSRSGCAAPSSHQPLGGSSGDWRHRLLRFHVPLALASAVVLFLFITLPLFDANVYAHVDITSGAFPQQRGENGAMDHGGDQADPINMDHGVDRTRSMDHSRDRTRSMDHGGDESEPREHGGDQAGSMDPDEMMEMGGGRSFNRRFTVATGYVATGLLAFTLLIGPTNLLLRRRNPISSYLRRDAGTWTAIASVIHVFYGLQMEGGLRNFLNMFVAPDGSPLTNSFGLGNWTGLAATVIVVGLLALSSDFALRKLKARPWKNLQRLNYALFALVIAHAFFYGALLRVTSPYTLLLALIVIAVFAGQTVGVWLWRRHSRTTARLA